MPENQIMSNLQLELLQIFNRNLADEQLLEIRNMLSKYFADKATEEMDKLWAEKGWTNETMEQWLNEHNRTPYKK